MLLLDNLCFLSLTCQCFSLEVAWMPSTNVLIFVCFSYPHLLFLRTCFAPGKKISFFQHSPLVLEQYIYKCVCVCVLIWTRNQIKHFFFCVIYNYAHISTLMIWKNFSVRNRRFDVELSNLHIYAGVVNLKTRKKGLPEYLKTVSNQWETKLL